MRSFIVEPMRFGRLFLAGDAAHIVPATGAKILNLAMADVKGWPRRWSPGIAAGKTLPLDGYSERGLRRAWRVQGFSSWMSSMVHRFDDDPTAFSTSFSSRSCAMCAARRPPRQRWRRIMLVYSRCDGTTKEAKDQGRKNASPAFVVRPSSFVPT